MSASSPVPAQPPRRDPLARFPSSIREAYTRFLDKARFEDADTVVLAVLESYRPTHTGWDNVELLKDGDRLAEDLGVDSLTIAELIFFLEDLFSVTIRNEEVVNVRTVGELRAFLRQKLTGRATD